MLGGNTSCQTENDSDLYYLRTVADVLVHDADAEALPLLVSPASMLVVALACRLQGWHKTRTLRPKRSAGGIFLGF